ncbi:MAG: sensor histidine kinase [Acidimicrobiia bacterium]
MATLFELARSHTSLSGDDLAHLHRLCNSWGMLADLCFADLLLLAPVAGEEGHRFVILAQVRPTTDQTLYREDMLGTVVDEVERPLVARVWRLGEIGVGDAAVIGSSSERANVQAIPVRHRGQAIGLVTREAATTTGRRPGELERVYFDVFDRFARMMNEGIFPYKGDASIPEEAPRVGDGVVFIDADAHVRYASPNAVSSLHRLGIHANVQGQRLGDMGFDDAAVRTAFAAQAPVTEELEWGETSILIRVIPMVEGGAPNGALVLMRDVSELRRRDRMLLSKDATIREIHHRVKNNLQTIASLLRLHARRLDSTEAKGALAESVRRIRSIALVHETLAYEAGNTVPFGEVIRPLVRIVEDGLVTPERRVRFHVEGNPGDLPAEVATPLAVVLTELLQNAVDHGFPKTADGVPRRGSVVVRIAREGGEAVIDVRDDGVGLPPDFSLERASGLGLSIVRTLVQSELGGALTMKSDGGTWVQLRVPVAYVPRVER